MASSINASTSGGGGIITTADATGNLNIQSGGSTVVAVTATGAAITTTGALTLPVGTTGQRPTPVTGMQRYNSTYGTVEYYSGTAWVTFNTAYSASYLVVAGGGAGAGASAGSYESGGGGAGGLLSGSLSFVIGSVYSVTVGAGGTGTLSAMSNGSNSTLTGVTAAIGGGGGGV